MKYTYFFEEVRLADIPHVGGKNASLGEMIGTLTSKNIPVPSGFIVSADAYRHFLTTHHLNEKIDALLKEITPDNKDSLARTGQMIRTLIAEKPVPDDIAQGVIIAYQSLEKIYGKNWSAAVRSSATAEDLPNASFAGQQETYLNISGIDHILERIPHAFASLFTDRAISYRMHHGFATEKVALSIGIQKMVRSDLATSGVIFTLDTESGFDQVVYLTSSYGLGENIVQGIVNPDECYVHKPTRAHGFASIIKKRLGSKEIKLVFKEKIEGATTVENVPVPHDEQTRFSLTDAEILELADYALIIEKHYSELHKKPMPMDIEWAKDGQSGKLFIVQARPETIHANQSKELTKKIISFVTQPPKSSLLLTGQSIGTSIISGKAKLISSAKELHLVDDGDIVVTDITDPDWEPIMKKASGIITNRGGRTCHAAIVSRELNILAIVGTLNGTEIIKTGDELTLDCSQGSTGSIYKGIYPTKEQSYTLAHQDVDLPLMINIGNPDEAFASAHFPYKGVGLARLEFIINASIKIHPMALLHPEKIDAETKKTIAEITKNYKSAEDFFIKTLAQEIGTIAAAAFPRPVIVRFSDFKSNEYRSLIGGTFFEPEEENPMLGFRGAFRYHHPLYQEAFILECKAFLYARKNMGFTNIHGMIPFVRSLNEAAQVKAIIAEQGLFQDPAGFLLYMMCETPANVLLLEKYAQIFDGFSIGSNDLTQLALGVDRDSALVAELFDEENEAVQAFLHQAIQTAKKTGKKISICGEAPQTHPELAKKLLSWGIDALSASSNGFLTLVEELSKPAK